MDRLFNQPTDNTDQGMKSKLSQLMQHYIPYGVLRGTHQKDLLLSPDVALQFINDVEACGIVLMGLDGWHWYDQNKQRVVQDLTIDVSVGDDVLQGNNAVQESAKILRSYITQHLPKHIPLLSLTLDIPYEWDVYEDACLETCC